MFWSIKVRDTGKIEDYGPNNDLGKQRIIELSWGWTPFGEISENLADDAPRGHESVFILEIDLPNLIEQLQEVMKK